MNDDLLPAAQFLATLPRKRVITSAIITDARGRVLCVEPTYKPTWHLPGGTVEQGESPAEACRRECLEELGTAIDIGRLLAVGHHRPEGEDPHGALSFIYAGSLPEGDVEQLRPGRQELHGVMFLDDAARQDRLSELARILVTAGLRALQSGTTVEIDRGFSAPTR